MAIARQNNFTDVPGLNKELDNLYKKLPELTGQTVSSLPPVNQAEEGASFNLKQTDGTTVPYKKVNGSYQITQQLGEKSATIGTVGSTALYTRPITINGVTIHVVTTD